MLTVSKTVRGEIPCTSHHETAESYFKVVYRHGDLRVIECRDGIQWIVQKRANCGVRGAEWKSKSYCTTREGLNRAWRTLSGALGDMLDHFPERIERSSHG